MSFHTYAGTACDTVTCWDESVAAVSTRVPVITGELGESDCSAAYIDAYMQWADGHDISYLAWSWQVPPPGTSCARANEYLISSWDGSPSVIAPAGAAFAHHLATLAEP